MDNGKVFTVVLWIVLGINYGLNFSTWLNYLAVLLLAIHLLEFIFFFKTIKGSEDNLIKGFFQTLIFGILYIGPLKKVQNK
tara:strand:- start:438 stop:680 length:243 start_codon:yes stop_codon:yes gene_type:complete